MSLGLNDKVKSYINVQVQKEIMLQQKVDIWCKKWDFWPDLGKL